MNKLSTDFQATRLKYQKQNTLSCSHSCAFSGAKKPAPATAHTQPHFDELILVGNNSANSLINASFDEVFKNHNITGFLNQVNKTLPALTYNSVTVKPTVDLKTNYFMYGLPNGGSISDNNTSINVTKEGRIQISHDNLKDLLVDRNNLTSQEWGNTSISETIYNTIPGIKDLPVPSYVPLPGRSNISNKSIISGGIRFLDPWPQASWEKTALKRVWPPDPYTTRGPLRLTADKTNQAILMDTEHPSCLNVGKTYGVVPKAIATVNPVDSSVILAVQIENKNTNPVLGLAPWVVAPVKTPQSVKALAAFPVSKTVSQEIIKPKTESIPDWLRSIHQNSKWKADSQNDIMIIDPAAPGNQSKLNTNDTNWALYAIEGSDKAIVIRSMYNHKDHFQAFVKNSSEQGQSEYLELEYTGPKVTPGNKSVVVIKWEFVPLSALSNGQLQKFGQTGNLENEIKTISGNLKALIDSSKR